MVVKKSGVGVYISLFRRALSFDHTLYNFELTEAKASLRSQLSCNGTKLPLNSGSLRTDILIGLLHKIYILQPLIFFTILIGGISTALC